MYLHDLDIGLRIYLEIHRNDTIIECSSKIQEVISNGIIISETSEEGKKITFHGNDQVFITAAPLNKLHRWEVSNWSTHQLGVLSTATLISTEEGENFNRREAFRVFVGAKGDAWNEELKRNVITIRDISVVGVSFATVADYKVGDNLRITFSDLGYSIDLLLDIKRVQEVRGKKIYGATITVRNTVLFKYINDKQREEIRKQRFKEQPE